MKIRVVIQQGQIVKPGQQLWMGYAGCSSCYENTSPWDLHLAVPLIVAFYWRGVCVFRGGSGCGKLFFPFGSAEDDL